MEWMLVPWTIFEPSRGDESRIISAVKFNIVTC